MILSRADIKNALDDQRIKFSPAIEESQIGQASVDLRLGTQFTKWKKNKTGIRISVADGFKSIPEVWDTMDLPAENAFGQPSVFTLEPGEFVLAMTHESVEIPDNLIGHVEGRSTYARVGLSVHQTAPWIQPGWRGSIVLEIRNSGSFSIDLTPLRDRPCQLVFFELKSPVGEDSLYGLLPSDVYRDQSHPLRHG